MSQLKSAYLKIDRAAEHVDELSALLREKRPFRYVLETNTKTNERSTYAKKDEAVVDRCALIAGEALYALRSALDHAYWVVVSPIASDERARKAVQFPFSETAARLEEGVKNRLAHKVSTDFFSFIVGLSPHGETGGNSLLYLLHDWNATDKHRTLVPTADYSALDFAILRKQIPDMPNITGHITTSQGGRDITWPLRPDIRKGLGLPGLPIARIYEQELEVPVDIVFPIAQPGALLELEPTLNQLVGLVRSIVGDMERFTPKP